MSKIKQYKYLSSFFYLLIGLILIIFRKTIYSSFFNIIGTTIIIFSIIKFITYLYSKYVLKNSYYSYNLYNSIILFIIGLFIILFGETLSRFALLVLFLYLVISSIIKIIDLVKLTNKIFIPELILSILQLIISIFLFFNINKAIETVILILGIFLLLRSISILYKTYIEQNNNIIDAEINEH